MTFYLLSSSRLPDGSTLQFATDINDTKKQEEELVRFKDGIDLLPNGLMFWDAEDNLIAHNASAVAFSLRLINIIIHSVSLYLHNVHFAWNETKKECNLRIVTQNVYTISKVG